jgi:hypothetical protein
VQSRLAASLIKLSWRGRDRSPAIPSCNNVFTSRITLIRHRDWICGAVAFIFDAYECTHFRSQAMNTATQYSSYYHVEQAKKARFSLASLVAALFMVNLRESLDAATSGDKSDAAFAYGL